MRFGDAADDLTFIGERGSGKAKCKFAFDVQIRTMSISPVNGHRYKVSLVLYQS